MAKVSVIIPTYNYAHFVPEAIDSVLAQTLAPVEIIVVDDGSTDDTPAVLNRYGDKIRVVRKSNGGLAAARNTGVEAATGDLLAFLDADDRWLPHKLERQVNRWLAEPDLGLVHCGMLVVDSHGALLQTRLDAQEGRVAEELLLLERCVVIGGGSTALVPRKVFDEVGGYDPLMRHSEDWDFHFRVACRYRLGFVPEALAEYRQHGSNMHHNVGNMEKAMLYAFDKAFAADVRPYAHLRCRAYGRLHIMLAGSYFRNGQYQHFLTHAMKSVLLSPRNVARLLGYPIRRWQHRRSI